MADCRGRFWVSARGGPPERAGSAPGHSNPAPENTSPAFAPRSGGRAGAALADSTRAREYTSAVFAPGSAGGDIDRSAESAEVECTAVLRDDSFFDCEAGEALRAADRDGV